MNAPNPNPSDRDHEGLRRAQRAHEPSMEEILASIRSIIADDKPLTSILPQAPKPAPAPGPQIVYTNRVAPAPRAPEPPARAEPEAAEPIALRPPEPVSLAPTPPEPTPEPEHAPEAEPEAEPATMSASPEPAEASGASGEVDEPFASEETEAAVAKSFEMLSASIALRSSEMVEGMTRELLRPMLKSWLDDNLPSLVERLVRAEIQRVARGR